MAHLGVNAAMAGGKMRNPVGATYGASRRKFWNGMTH